VGLPAPGSTGAGGRRHRGLSAPGPNIRAMPTAPPSRLPTRTAPAAAPGAAVRAALRARVLARIPDLLVPPEAGGPTAPLAGGHRPKPAGLCAACRGPARSGFTRCFHCDLHAESAPGLLADAVAPIAYAPKGGPLARDLWLYKSGRPGAGEAATGLLALLLMYLHDHRGHAWRRAGLPPPTHVSVVPTGRGRPGPHPLQALAARYLALPWANLTQRPGADAWGRCLDPERFQLRRPLEGARVLLLDDTWVSGGAAQSAAVALKLGGCRSVVTVVLGRHVAAGVLPAAATRLAAGAGARLVNRL
jgi:hypothetical protein